MSAKNVLGLIFSNSYDEVLPEITALRTMGSVPYAGRYRFIDFPLSNMVNAGVSQVGVITNSNYRSLMDHVGNGKAWDLSRKYEGLIFLPPFSRASNGMYEGKVDALYGNLGYIKESGKEYVLISDCNIISGIDYDEMLRFHLAKNADITVACTYGLPPKVNMSTEYISRADDKVEELNYIDCFTSPVRYSLKTMIIKRTLLERLLHEANSKKIVNIEDLIAKNTGNLAIYAFEVKGYVKVIESLASYYQANIDLLDPDVRKAIFDSERPVYTKTGDRVPAYYGINSRVENSLIADGCKIEGEVVNCVLFRGVSVGKGAKLKNCIVMQDSVIGDECSMEYIICDKDVIVKAGRKLAGAESFPVYVGKGIVI